jgi:hypothetical protein
LLLTSGWRKLAALAMMLHAAACCTRSGTPRRAREDFRDLRNTHINRGGPVKASIDQCRFLVPLASEVLDRLDDSHRALEPQPGAKTAGWLIGHLAVTGDYARHLCGARALCPREWRAAFNPGTRPSHDAASYPTMSELVETFRSVYRDLCATALEADPALLGITNPYEPTRAGFPTSGDFVAYLASSHLAYHLGQLIGWCAAAGLGRVRAPAA